MAGIACGLVAIGTCNGEVTSTILQTMMERSETEVKETNARNLALGLGLTFLGKICFLFTFPAQLNIEIFKSPF